jgi:pimeloyl-ACP methyl ester carboxylesterase
MIPGMTERGERVERPLELGPLVPFRRGTFEELPERPWRPHRFADTKLERIAITTDELGACAAAVRTYGSGPPLLLVHGLMTTSYSWRYVLEPLGTRYTLFMPDLPGNGDSDRPLDRPYHPDALARWLGAVQRAVGIRGCPVIGNSMGGYLCMRLALDDAGAMARLVNLHSPGVPEARLWALRVGLAIPGMKGLLARLARRKPERWVHRNVHYWDESLKSREEARIYGGQLASVEGSRAFVKHLAETMAIGPIRAFHRRLRARKAAGEPFPVPLLLVYAERDPMVPPRFGDVLADLIPDARLVRLSDASHFAHVDAVDRFLPAIEDFLAGAPT